MENSILRNDSGWDYEDCRSAEVASNTRHSQGRCGETGQGVIESRWLTKAISMASTSEHELAELKRELAELVKQAERLAGRAREISDRLRRSVATQT